MKKLFQNRLLNAVLKFLILAGLMYVLYRQLFGNENLDIAYQHFLLNFHGNYILLSIVILLMIINWSIEAIKWKFLIDKLQEVPGEKRRSRGIENI